MIWVRRSITILVGLVLLGLGLLYAGTELFYRRTLSVDLPVIAAASDPADLVEGARLAGIAGCLRCHGAQGQGQVLVDDFATGRIVAPALARIAEMGSDGQLARAIRHGIGVDARPLLVMPTQALNGLADEDVARLIGWMWTFDQTIDDRIAGKWMGPLGRLGLVTGRLPSTVNLTGGQRPLRPMEFGRYFGELACSGCHAPTQDQALGLGGPVAPALRAAMAGYDDAALTHLLRTGTNKEGRRLPTMARASEAGLDGLSDAEIAAIRAWVVGRGR